MTARAGRGTPRTGPTNAPTPLALMHSQQLLRRSAGPRPRARAQLSPGTSAGGPSQLIDPIAKEGQRSEWRPGSEFERFGESAGVCLGIKISKARSKDRIAIKYHTQCLPTRKTPLLMDPKIRSRRRRRRRRCRRFPRPPSRRQIMRCAARRPSTIHSSIPRGKWRAVGVI